MSAFQPQAAMGSCALLFTLVLSCCHSKVDGDRLSATLPEGLKVFQRQCKGSAFPCPAAPRWRAGMPCRKRAGRQTRLLTLLKRKVGALQTKEGDCPGMHGRNLQVARCSTAWRISWARSLCPPGDKAPLCSLGCSLGALSLPPPGSQAPLLAYGCRCLSLRLCGAPIPDRRCHLNPDKWETYCVPTQPRAAARCLAVATTAPRTLRIMRQPGRGVSPAGAWPWAAFCAALWSTNALVAERSQLNFPLYKQKHEQTGVRLRHSLGSSHPLTPTAVSQPVRPLMLLTLLLDYFGVMSFALLSCPSAQGCCDV